MLAIRLQRVGRKNSPDFRIVLAEKHRSASKKVIQVFGKYNPKTKDFNLSDQGALLDRIKQNIEISPTVRNLLIEKKIIEGKKVKAWRPKRKETEEIKDESTKVEGSTNTKASADKGPAEAKSEQTTESKIEANTEDVKLEEKKDVSAEAKKEEQKEMEKEAPAAKEENFEQKKENSKS